MNSKRRTWAGLTSIGTEPMSGPERTWLGELAWRQLRRIYLSILGPAVSIISGVLIVVLVPQGMSFLIGCSLFLMVPPVASMLFARDAWKRRRGLLRDLARGEVEVFEGTIGLAVGADAVLERLARKNAFENLDRKYEVRILCESGFLHAIDGAYRDDFLTPDVLEVAAPRPRGDFIAPGENEEPRLFALSKEETKEIEAHASQMWRTPLQLIGVIAYVSLGVVMWATQGNAWLKSYGLVFAIWGVLGAFSVVRLVKRYRTAVLLARDARRGEAVEVCETDEHGVTTRVVVLAESKLIWSVGELPAEWRSKKL